MKRLWIHAIEREGHPLVAVQFWEIVNEYEKLPRGEVLLDRELVEVFSSLLPMIEQLLGTSDIVWTGWRPEPKELPGLTSALKMLSKFGGLKKLLGPGTG